MIHPSPAATVILVRGGADLLEVLLLERRPDSGFVPGAYVFPGGAVDAADHADELHVRTDGPPEPAASTALGVPAGGLAHRVAGLRESFEEAGVLLAARDGVPVDAPLVDALQGLRAGLDAGHTPLAGVCRDHDLTLRTAALRPFAHWITPVGPPRRYDTRFFLAPAPADQVATPDGTEVVAAAWMTPDEALGRAAHGEIPLILPTERCLVALGAFPSATALLEAVDQSLAAGVRSVADHGGRRLALGDDELARSQPSLAAAVERSPT